MKTKIFTLSILLSAVLFLFSQVSIAQQWLTAGNNVVAGQKLGSLNNEAVNIVTNNTSRIFITPTGRVGIGTNAPVNILTLKSSGSTPAASWIDPSTNPILVGFSEAVTADINLAAASNTVAQRPVYQGKRSRGTLASPLVVQNNDFITSLVASGYDGSSFQNAALIDFFVDGVPSPGNVPTRISFVTGSNGGNRQERLKVGSTGDFSFNNTQLFIKQSTGALGIGSVSPHASSILDINSTTKGVLVPRMTIAQRNAIASPATGLLIFQTDGAPGFYFFRAGWQALGASASANTALSNLGAPTAVNVPLLPGITAATDLGASSKSWRSLYLSNDVYIAGLRFLSDKGNGNNFFGTQAGATTTGLYNTATGYQTLFSNTTGYSNTAHGYQSLYTNTGTYNTASGYQSLFYNTSGYANNANGAFALYSNTTGSYNTAFGADGLIGNTTGNNNTAVGLDALRNISTTSNNTGIGYYAGENTYGTTQGTFLGAQTRGGTGLSNVTAVGYGAVATASNQVMLGNSSTTSVVAAGGYVIYSDGRFKKDIKEEVPGLDFINKLRPVTYHYNIHGLNKHIEPSSTANYKGVMEGKGMLDSENKINEEAIINKERKLYTGFVAQEVEEAAKKISYDFSGVHKPTNSKDLYGLSYSEFVVPLVKAVQELSKKTDEIAELKKEVGELKVMVTKLLETRSSTSASLSSITLDQNSPNPFGNTTRINYSIPGGFKKAQLVIADITGKTIKQIPLTVATNSSVILDASTFSSGSFTYTIWADGKKIQSKKMIVAR